MTFQVSPGEATAEIDLTTKVPIASLSHAAMCMISKWGPIHEIVTVSSEDSTRYFTLVIDQLGNELSAPQPNRFSLHQNYPNPFNPVTTITFDLAKSELVSLNVYDVNGYLIKNLVNNEKNPGQYNVNWNGNNTANENVAGGVYFYRIDTDSYSATKKMILLK